MKSCLMQMCSQPRGTTCSPVLLAFGNVVWLFQHLVTSHTLSSPPLHLGACWALPAERMSSPAHALIHWPESSCSAWSRYYRRWLYEQREGRLHSPSPPLMPSKAGRLSVVVDQQQQQHLGAGWKCGISGPTPELQNQRGHKPQETGARVQFFEAFT